MSNQKPDEQEEKPLDPVMENVRRKMVRLQLVSGGVMLVMLMAVLGAIVYKVTRLSDQDAAQTAAVPVPGDAPRDGHAALPARVRGFRRGSVGRPDPVLRRRRRRRRARRSSSISQPAASSRTSPSSQLSGRLVATLPMRIDDPADPRIAGFVSIKRAGPDGPAGPLHRRRHGRAAHAGRRASRRPRHRGRGDPAAAKTGSSGVSDILARVPGRRSRLCRQCRRVRCHCRFQHASRRAGARQA